MAKSKEVKQWITINGKHIPIFEGESKEDAVKRVTNKKDDTDDKKEKEDFGGEYNGKRLTEKEMDEVIEKEYDPDAARRAQIDALKKRAQEKQEEKKADKEESDKSGIRKRIANGDYDHQQGKNMDELESELKKNGLELESADAHDMRNSKSFNDEKVTLYDKDGTVYEGTYNRYSDGGREVVDIKPKKNYLNFEQAKRDGRIDKDADYEDFVDYSPIKDDPNYTKKRVARETADENDAYDRAHKEGRYADSKDPANKTDADFMESENKRWKKEFGNEDSHQWSDNKEPEGRKTYRVHYEDGNQRLLEANSREELDAYLKETEKEYGKATKAEHAAEYDKKDTLKSTDLPFGGKSNTSLNYDDVTKLPDGSKIQAEEFSSITGKPTGGYTEYTKSNGRWSSKGKGSFDNDIPSMSKHLQATSKGVVPTIKIGNKEVAVSNQPLNANIDKISKALGISKKDMGFIDKMTNGYRVSAGTRSEAEAQKIAEEIKKKTGITVQVRKRGGYGSKAGSYDIIVPFAR